MQKILFILMISLLTTSCGHEKAKVTSENFLASPAGSFEEIYENLQFLSSRSDVLAPPSSRPEHLTAPEILKSIHPWLQKGVGLKEVSRGNFSYLAFSEKIPESVANSILEQAFEDKAFDSGFLLLQKSFWNFVIQRENTTSLETNGTTIAFLTQSLQPIAGVYFADRRLIAVDIYASTGTLAHELRHHSQRTNDEETKVRPQSGPAVLTQECREAVRKYFGEVQATLIQMPYWARVLKDVPLTPKDLSQIHRLKDRSTIALHDMILANLLYPVDSAYWVTHEKTCNESVRKLVDSVADFANEQKEELVLLLPQLLNQHRANYRACLENGCSPREQVKILEESETRRALAIAAFNRAYEERINKLRSLLLQLHETHPETYLDLQSSITSVRELASKSPHSQAI